MEIRKYQAEDLEEIVQLFYDANSNCESKRLFAGTGGSVVKPM